MKRIALITGILTVALLLSSGLAFAQEIKYKVIEGEPDEEGIKRIEICRTMFPEMGDMMGGACCDMHQMKGAHGMMGGMMCGSGGGAMMCGPGGGGMACGSGGGKMIKARVFGGHGMGGGMGCCGDGGGMMGGACGKLKKLGGVGQYEKCAEMLELSKKQLATLKDIRMASKKAAIQAMADVKIAHVELDEILKGCCPDLAKVKARISEIASLREDMCLARVSALQKAQKVLTKKQLDKFISCKMGTCAKKGKSCEKTRMKKEMKACEKTMKMKKAEMKEHMEKMEVEKEKMKEKMEEKKDE